MTKPGGKSPSNARGAYLDGMGRASKFRNMDAVIKTTFAPGALDRLGEPRNRQERRVQSKQKARRR